MKLRLAQEIFINSGGLDLLEGYGIEPGENPLETFSKVKYPSKKGTMAPIAGIQPATLVADGESIHLFAGIAPLPGRRNNVVVDNAISPFAPGSAYPTRRLADLAIKAIGGQRPLLVYVVGRSWMRALNNVAPCLDPLEFRVSGEVNLTFDRLRVDAILNVMKTHGIASPNKLRHLVEAVGGIENCGATLERDEIRMRDMAVKVMGIRKTVPLKERTARVEGLMDDIRFLPSTTDGPSWSMASRLVELDAEKNKKTAKKA